MRAITAGGHRLKCKFCHRKYATHEIRGMAMCRYCLRAFLIGHFVGKIMRPPKEASE